MHLLHLISTDGLNIVKPELRSSHTAPIPAAHTLAPRVARLRPSPTAKISDSIRALEALGRSVINLGEGELDFDTPLHIRQAGIEAIEGSHTKYTSVSGTAELKKAIIGKFAADNGLCFSPQEVIAGAGAKQLILNALLATVAADDEVIVPAPYWVSYPDMVRLADGTPRIVPCDETTGWKLQPDALRAAIGPRTRWLILNSPNNPTGAIYSAAEMKALTDVLLEHPHVLLLADDIYEYLCYEPTFVTPLQVEPRLRERTLTVNGVSKSFSMTGWRLGFAAGPAWLVTAMTTLQSQSTSNPSSISQMAAIRALESDRHFLRGWLAVLRNRRDIALDILSNAPGLRCSRPDGAFYLFVDCGGLIGRRTPGGGHIGSDLDVASYLLEATGVGVVHGEAFGTSPCLRIAYAVDTTVLTEACGRIVEACKQLR